MAKKNMLMPLLLLGGLGIGFYLYKANEVPMGLTIDKVVRDTQNLGVTADGKELTAKAVTGSFRREDGQNSPTVTSELSDKPMLVIFEDNDPVFAEVINYSDIDDDPALIEECQTTQPTDAEELTEWNSVCDEATFLFNKQLNGQWREIAEGAGATQESIDTQFPIPIEEEVVEDDADVQEAESWLGIKNPQMFINTLQSNQVW